MNTQNVYKKLPRLFIDTPLNEGAKIPLDKGQIHYLTSVLRQKTNAQLRIFNGQDGEWLCTLNIETKKSATVTCNKCIHTQLESNNNLTLIFSPIKKNRMDMLVEKAVELGVTNLRPALTQNTEIRKINAERITAQIIEASEQCERLDIPKLHKLTPLLEALTQYHTVFIALEREENKHIRDIDIEESGNSALLIGPEGGFTEEEKSTLLSLENVVPISLGPRILRAETAAIYGLSHLIK